MGLHAPITQNWKLWRREWEYLREGLRSVRWYGPTEVGFEKQIGKREP